MVRAGRCRKRGTPTDFLHAQCGKRNRTVLLIHRLTRQAIEGGVLLCVGVWIVPGSGRQSLEGGDVMVEVMQGVNGAKVVTPRAAAGPVEIVMNKLTRWSVDSELVAARRYEF